MVLLPTTEPLARNSTFTIPPPAALAEALKAIVAGATKVAPAAGALSVTTGGAAEPTLITSGADVALVPSTSITLALNDCAPATGLVQLTLYGGVVALPIS